MLIGPHASPDEIEQRRAEILAAPAGWIGQELVALSTHPTFTGDRLEPRHVDLRVFAFVHGTGPDDVVVADTGLTRDRAARQHGRQLVARRRGEGHLDRRAGRVCERAGPLMCGICGEIRFDGSFADVGAVDRMNTCHADRGPDGTGTVATGRVAFAHRRLKIIDLEATGAQPMYDVELGLTVVFNGCIYNYPELRDTLRAKGYRFFSTSDTEVILKAYHAWGTGCVERFKGMFAFAIHERDSGRVVLARDRLGIKPLYLVEGDGFLRFASTLPALLRAGDVDTSIDVTALHHYLSFHSIVPPPRTILTGVRKLPPATIRVIEADGTQPRDPLLGRAVRAGRASGPTGTIATWREALLDALRTAVRRRMVADVPVGVLLSGGIDSSIVVALLAEAGPDRPRDVQHRLRGRGRRERRRVRVLRRRRPRVRHRPPRDPHRRRPAGPGARRLRRRDERADGQPRLRRVLPADRRTWPAHHGRAVGPGRRRGAGRLLLVPAARRGRRGATSWTPTAAVFFDRPHEDVLGLLQPQWQVAGRRLPGLRRHAVRRAGAPRARPPPSTPRCASTPR